jgi:hypothetical protein
LGVLLVALAAVMFAGGGHSSAANPTNHPIPSNGVWPPLPSDAELMTMAETAANLLDNCHHYGDAPAKCSEFEIVKRQADCRARRAG